MSESGYLGLKDKTRAFITNYQLPITNYQLPITNYQLPITNYLNNSRQPNYNRSSWGVR
ncbi:MAG: hypothetical protein ACKO98_00355 [Dolichospermum sp.]